MRNIKLSFAIVLLLILGGSKPQVIVEAQGSDLFTRRALSLTSAQPEVTGTIDLDPQTAWIEVAIDRPTSVSSGIVWASGTQVEVTIEALVDGVVHFSKARSSGGIRSANSVEYPAYKLRWSLPSGYFDGTVGKRLGETGSTFQVRVRFELLRGSTLTSSVVVRSGSAALNLPPRHNSVAFVASESALDESGDGFHQFSLDAGSSSGRAAFVTIGSRGTALAGTITVDGGGETFHSALWDVADGGSSTNARAYAVTGLASGSRQFTSDLTAASSQDHFLGVVTLSGVNQGTPTGNVQTVGPTFGASPASVTVTGVDSADMVLDYFQASVSPTVGANQTERELPASTSFPTFYRISTQSGADGGVMSWTWSTDTTHLLKAVVFKTQPTIALTGTVTASITESDIVAGGKTIILTATDDTFADNLASLQYVGGQDNSFAGTTSNTDITFALNNGLASTPAAGDLVVVTFCTGSTVDRTLSITNTAGTAYTLMGSELFSDDTFDVNMRVAYRFMPGTPETAVRFAGGSGNAADAATYAIQVFRNVDTGTPMDVSVVTQSQANSNSRLINPPSITPSTTGAWIGVSGCGAGGTLTADYTSPGGAAVTDFRTDGQTDTNDSGVAAWHNTTWTSGAYDAAALTGGGTDTTSDSWASVVWALRPATDNIYDDTRDELRDGCDSDLSEGTGWDALKSTTMPVANVVRTSNTVVTITLAAAGSYNITALETITCIIPAAILNGGGAITATPTFTIATGGGGAPPPCFRSLKGVGCIPPVAIVESNRRRLRRRYQIAA